MSTKPRVIVVAKRSSLSRVELDGEASRARLLLRRGHESVKKWKPAHLEHERTLEAVVDELSDLGANALVLHGSHAEFSPRGAALVVTVGGDGTLLAASHSVSDTPILGVNSAPEFSVGFFCAAERSNLRAMLTGALDGSLRHLRLARMAVRINGVLRSERVLNEALFCHSEPAATSTYALRVGRHREEQKSSGLWVGTAAGSTAVLRSAGGKVMPLTSRELQLVVREPYMGDGRRYHLRKQVVGPRGSVVAMSKMESARIFLDGPYRRLSVRLGDEVRFESSRQSLDVLGLSARRPRRR